MQRSLSAGPEIRSGFVRLMRRKFEVAKFRLFDGEVFTPLLTVRARGPATTRPPYRFQPRARR
jgi:hypothetical protein